jgi:hypothetical protein
MRIKFLYNNGKEDGKNTAEVFKTSDVLSLQAARVLVR